jgi:hypothetical protein
VRRYAGAAFRRPVSAMLIAACAAIVALSGATAIAAQASARVAVPDVDGREVFPFDAAARAYVFLFVRTDCPISNRYAPEIRRLYEHFARQDVAFWLVYPGGQSPAGIREHVKEYELPVAPTGARPALRDIRMRLVDLTGARVTPEAAIFDASRTLVYRGRIDDRYVDVGRARRVVTTRDAHDVLTAVVAGRPAPYSSRPASGCFIDDLR